MSIEYPISPLLERVRAVLPGDLPVYLVGGAVRDLLLSLTTHDLDFVVFGDAMVLARQVANNLGGAYYALDEERETARVILINENGLREVLDFARLRGGTLEEDLRRRDFTVNAMALDMHNPQTVFDPLSGGLDLLQKRLRACSPASFSDDPVRVLRALRQAGAYHLRIEPDSLRLLRQAASLLTGVSVERLRDELFRILDGRQPGSVLLSLDYVGALRYVLPELDPMKGITQSAPHVKDVWQHSLDLLRWLDVILEALNPAYDPERANSLTIGLAVVRLGRFRNQIKAYLQEPFTPERVTRPLLFLAALFHDVGKPQTRSIDEHDRVRFFGHEELGAKIAVQRGHSLHLSNDEIEYLKLIIQHHMRPLLLGNGDNLPSRKAIYRFFRVTGAAGVGVCLLSLADFLAIYGTSLPQSEWKHHLDVLRSLLEAWWEKPQEAVSPPALLSGHDLIANFQLKPGRKIGELLEAVREAQATGQVDSREQALVLVQTLLRES